MPLATQQDIGAQERRTVTRFVAPARFLYSTFYQPDRNDHA